MTLDDIIGDPLVDLLGENGPYPPGRTALGSSGLLGLGQVAIERLAQLEARTMLEKLKELPRGVTARLPVSEYYYVLAAHGLEPPGEGW